MLEDEDTLGDDESPSGLKASYILLMFAVMGLLFFGSIGAKQGTKDVIYFYIIFGTFLGLVPILFDVATKGRDQAEQLDTVTVEEPSHPWLGPKTQLVVGILIGAYVLFRISTTGSAFVGSPEFGVFDSKIGNALLSGAVGITENWVFFGFLAPTAYAFARSRTNSSLFATLVMIMVTTGVFTGYHSFRYGANELALQSVAFFALLNSLAVLFFRSLIVSDFFHFFNNFGSTIFGAARVALQFA